MLRTPTTPNDKVEFTALAEEPVQPVVHQATRIPDDQSLYDALDARGLLRKSNVLVGMKLIKNGELGLITESSDPKFLAPGYHTLFLDTHKYHPDRERCTVNITDKDINHGPIQIVTIEQGELGLSVNQDKNIILQPGRHILLAPHRMVKRAKVNEEYVNLGIYHQISIPIGTIAIAYDQGAKIIITPTPLEVDEEHKKYLRCTDGKMFTITSPTFRFDPETGIKSVQQADMQLKPLMVTTHDNVQYNVVGSVRYKVVDPIRAFLTTDDVEKDIMIYAQATLTSVFQKLSVDKVSKGLATMGLNGKGKEDDDSDDMLHRATMLFMEEFQVVVKGWGVEAQMINITSMVPTNESYNKAMQQRAEQAIKAASQYAVVEQETQTAIKTAERDARVKTIQAEAEAASVRMRPDAELYAAQKKAEAAKLLTGNPLAQQLALMNAQAEIARALGDKTVVTGMDLGGFSFRTGSQTFFMNANQQPDNLVQLAQKSEEPAMKIVN